MIDTATPLYLASKGNGGTRDLGNFLAARTLAHPRLTIPTMNVHTI